MKTTNQMLNDYNNSISGRKPFLSSNSILTIQPYYLSGSWVFDDERVGLNKEPFVSGADQFIEYVLNKKGLLQNGKKGFSLIFSTIPFLGFDYELNFIAYQNMGSLYTVKDAHDFKGCLGENLMWLCPALNLYFKHSPNTLYVSFKINNHE